MNEPYIYLAPLEGINGLEFRNVFARHFGGVDEAIAPFVSLNHPEIRERIKSWDIPAADQQEMKTIPQFMGRNVRDFLHLAKWVTHKGYEEINWNLGCPVRKVVSKGRGCGQLKFPDQIRAFLEALLPNIAIKFSIKTRLGLDDPDEIFALMELYNDYPLHQVFLHPRIGRQMYSGEVMLDYFEECLKISRHELVFNGDIKTPDDFKRIQQKFPQTRKFMIGRGLLADPFLAEKIRDSEVIYDKSRFMAFHDELYAVLESKFWNKVELLGKMKEYWLSFSYLLENREPVKKMIVRSQSLEEYQANVREIMG